MMQVIRSAALLTLAVSASFLSQGGYAATGISTMDASGRPSSSATPSFTLDFGASQALNNISFSWEYDADHLSFNKGLSTVDYGGQTRSLSSFIDFLKQEFGGSPQYFSTEAGSVGATNKIFDYTLFADAPINVSGPMVFNLAFDLGGTTAIGQDLTVKIAGNLVDPDWNEFPYEGQAVIHAVPEPEVWLLWLGGLGLLAWRSFSNKRNN